MKDAFNKCNQQCQSPSSLSISTWVYFYILSIRWKSVIFSLNGYSEIKFKMCTFTIPKMPLLAEYFENSLGFWFFWFDWKSTNLAKVLSIGLSIFFIEFSIVIKLSTKKQRWWYFTKWHTNSNHGIDAFFQFHSAKWFGFFSGVVI